MTHSFNWCPHCDLRNLNLHAGLLEPPPSRNKGSLSIAARIEAPQRLSTRAVYKSKWAIFVEWCRSNKVDFWSPSVTEIADFLLHLFQDRKLQPSTIEGYRMAIADMVGNDKFNISKDENPLVG